MQSSGTRCRTERKRPPCLPSLQERAAVAVSDNPSLAPCCLPVSFRPVGACVVVARLSRSTAGTVLLPEGLCGPC